MTNDPKSSGSKASQSREQRLAAQLRANLRRRKTQAREKACPPAEKAGPGSDSLMSDDRD